MKEQKRTNGQILKRMVVCFGVMVGVVGLRGVEYEYGVEVGVIDVTAAPWELDNSGEEDVTATLQALVDETIPRKTWLSPDVYWPKILYFPDGVYRLTDSIVGAILDSGAALGGFVIQGQSRDGVIFKLDDNAEGFGDVENRKYVLDYFAGSGTNNAFVNHLENVTIDIGAGNPGAVGVRFHANNTGAVRNVKIVSSDPAGAGYAGLEAIKNTNGPWMIRGLEIEGFDYGLNLSGSENARHMVSVQDLAIRGQGIAGVQLRNFVFMVVGGESENTVPFVMDLDDASMVTLLGTRLVTPGVSVEGAAIESPSQVLLRDVVVEGYGAVVRSNGVTELASMPEGGEWRSHPRNYAWEDTPDQTLGLAIEQPPEPARPMAEDWAVVDSATFLDDDTRAIREAMASGKPAIYFKPQTYRITDTIRIPPHVKLIAGQFATLRADAGLSGDGRPLFELGPSAHDTVVVERILGAFDAQSNPNPLIRNAGNSTLVLRDLFWVSGPVYRSEPTRGKVFIENVHSLPGTQKNPLDIAAYEIRGQSVWAYQWNPEMLFPHVRVDGGIFRAYGFKTGEMRGPMVEVVNHGYAELFGGTLNVTHDELDIPVRDTVMLWAEDGNVSANFIEMAQLTGGGMGWGRHQYVAVETRNGETRTLSNGDASVLHRTNFAPQYGAVVNLYTGYYPQDTAGNMPPVAYLDGAYVDWTGYNYTFRGVAEDADAWPSAQSKLHWRVTNGPGIAYVGESVEGAVQIHFERAGEYTVELSATDGAMEGVRTQTVRVLPKRHSMRFGRLDAYRYTDNAPQDGETDFFHPALIQVGDDAQNTHSQLKFEVPLRALAGSTERIEVAEIRLRLQSASGLEAVQAAYSPVPAYGTQMAEDFAAQRIALGASSLAGKNAGDWISVDISAAVQAALAAGQDYVTIWLTADYSDDGVAQTALFSSTTSADATQRPEFFVAFRPVRFKESAVSLGGDLYLHPVFGYYYDYGEWIYQHPLGWLSVMPELDQVETLYFYAPERGWLHTSDLLYPWYYDYGEWAWKLAQ